MNKMDVYVNQAAAHATILQQNGSIRLIMNIDRFQNLGPHGTIGCLSAYLISFETWI